MKLTDYLYERPNTRNWYLRWMVPIAARPVIGRAEFTKSLGVTDRRVARELAGPHIVAWKAKVRAALAGTTPAVDPSAPLPGKAGLEEAAVLVGYEVAGDRVDALIKAKARLGADAYSALRVKFEERHKRAVRDLQAGDLTYWVDHAKAAFRKRGWPIVDGSSELAIFVEALAIAGRDAFAHAIEKMDGREELHVPSKLVQNVSTRRYNRAASGETILDLFEKYANQRLAEKRKRIDTINQDRKIVEQFSRYIGMDIRVSSIEKALVREWRDAVAAVPPNYRKMTKFRGKDLRESAVIAKSEGTAGMSPITVNKYISTLSPLFDWLISEDRLSVNPCEGLYYSGKKGANPRPPFSVDQLNQILTSPLFTGFAQDGKEHQAGSHRPRDWRFWLPLICMFTGARLGEVAQVRVEDVKAEHGIRFIYIRHDEKTGQQTKSGLSRPAAIHPTLVSLGFLELVEKRKRECRETEEAKLFPELSPNERGQISGDPSRFWRRYLESIGIKKGADGFGSHSFRHLLADQMRLAGYFDAQIAVAIGHNHKTVTSGYGRIKQGNIAVLNEMIHAVQFDGVVFDHLLPDRL